MKWLGQHIYDQVSRFRDDVYIEGISTGTIASGGNLGLDSNNKIVKAVDNDYTPTLSVITDCAITLVAGTEYVVNDADGGAMVLPSVSVGDRITILIGTTITSNTITITAASGDLLKGYAILRNTLGVHGAPTTYAAPDGTDDEIITLDGSRRGGIVGDKIELVGISTEEWRVRATLVHNGSDGVVINPFS